jgi:hypothetical protein
MYYVVNYSNNHPDANQDFYRHLGGDSKYNNKIHYCTRCHYTKYDGFRKLVG